VRPIDPARIERILVRGTNWVGDAVMSVPALREIRRIFPAARISLLVRPWVRDVYSAVDFVDETIDFDKDGPHRGTGGILRLGGQLRDRRFDLAILLQNAFEAAFVAFSAGIPLRLGYARDARSLLLTHAPPIDPAVRKLHQCYYYLGILSGAGLLPARIWEGGYEPSIAVGVRDTDRESARRMLLAGGIGERELVVGINPGAYYGGAKRWVSERYAKVADALYRTHGAKIVIFGAANERRIADEVAGLMDCPSLVLAGRTTLGELMGLLATCRLLITNDSGPMHLAAALGTPQLAIFGSTSEIATGPVSPRARVIKHQVDCNPCFLRECPIDFRCMTRITVETVLKAADDELGRSGRV
jgi:heptosyltransferase II